MTQSNKLNVRYIQSYLNSEIETIASSEIRECNHPPNRELSIGLFLCLKYFLV